MTDCHICGNRDYLCQRCKLEALEDRHGTPAEQDRDRWVLGANSDLWHAGVAFDGATHSCACGTDVDTPLAWSTEDLRWVPDEYDAPVCRDCVATLEGTRAETVPADATFERASELATDGGLSECELVDRAVREAVSLVKAGDALEIAVATTVVDLGLEHRRTDVLERTEDRLEQRVATDGGRDLDFDAVREEVPFFVRRAETSGASAAIHLPAETATEDDPEPGCRYNNRRGVAWRTSPPVSVPNWLLEKRACSECFGTSSQDTYHGRKPADVLEDAGFDVVTDGGRDLGPRGREAFLDGDAHYCDICDRPFDSWDDLANHDCRPVRTDGGVSSGRRGDDTVELRIRTDRVNLAAIISTYSIGLECGPTFGPGETFLEDVLEGMDDVYPADDRVHDVVGWVGDLDSNADLEVDVELVELEGEPSIDPHDGDGGDDPDGPGQDGVPIAISDGGRNIDFVAVCEQCGELDRGDIEQAGDALEDHDPFHDTEIKRVATDGGFSASGADRDIEGPAAGSKVCFECGMVYFGRWGHNHTCSRHPGGGR